MVTVADRQVAVLIDFENVGLNPIRPLFDQVSEVGRVVVRRAYGDWSTSSRAHRDQLMELGIEPVHLFHAASGKNSSDIRLAIEAIELLYQSTVDTFVIVSSDTDFVPLVSKLRASGKTVIGAGPRATASRTLVNSCDRYFYLDQDQPPSGDGRSSKQQQTESLLERGVRAAVDEQGAVTGSKLHQTILRLDPSFDFRALGHSTFRRFLEASAKVNVDRHKDLSDVTVHLAEPPDVETWAGQIDAAWSLRAPKSGQFIHSSTAAGEAAHVLGVTKLSASPYKTLQKLLDASENLSRTWSQSRSKIIRR